MSENRKPLLRGHFHQAAFFMAIGACLLLISKRQHLDSLWPAIVYSLSLISLLGISALYHRVNWRPINRMIMRRLDHAAIYFLIAGTMTPICYFALSPSSSRNLLITAWTVAGFGILLSILFTKKPKWLNALLCLASGLVILPYLPEMGRSLGQVNINYILAGAVAYILGALAYATKRPNLFPKTFGYHEVFHSLVLVGAISHFLVINSLV